MSTTIANSRWTSNLQSFSYAIYSSLFIFSCSRECIQWHAPYKKQNEWNNWIHLYNKVCIITLVEDLLLWYIRFSCTVYMNPRNYVDHILTESTITECKPYIMTNVYSQWMDLHFPMSVETVNMSVYLCHSRQIPLWFETDQPNCVWAALLMLNNTCMEHLYTLFIFLHVTIMQSAGIRTWWPCAMWSY